MKVISKELLVALLLLTACDKPMPETTPLETPTVVAEPNPYTEPDRINLKDWKIENDGKWSIMGAAHGIIDGADYTTLDYVLSSDEYQVQYSFKVDKWVGPTKWEWPDDGEFIFWWHTRKD